MLQGVQLNATITDRNKKSFNFETATEIRDFCKTELAYWKEANKKLGSDGPLNGDVTKVKNLHDLVVEFDRIEENLDEWDEVTLSNQLNNLKKNKLNHLSGDWLWHGHAFIPRWIELHGVSKDQAESFRALIVDGTASALTASVDKMKGCILAYEFLMQGESELQSRRATEERSLEQLRSQLADKTQEITRTSDQTSKKFDELYDDENALSKKRNRVHNRLFKRQLNRSSMEFAKSHEAWDAEMEDLKIKYGERLFLAKPADYWEKAAKNYRNQGYIWSLLLAFLIVVSIISLGDFFIAWLYGKQMPLSLKSFQGLTLFASAAALVAYSLRVLSRLAFSSFHLMRDAQERRQLTYLYLSLRDQDAVEKDALNIVLQALFSRSETGLLLNEHGPTMPGLAEALRAANRTPT